tara:strand:+ start:546 stop:968 length:423 start_codon:yes stop_codon:yes gene_type:complete
MTTPNLLIVNPRDIPYIWNQVKPLVDKALEYSSGEITSNDLLKLLLNGRNELWCGIDDTGVTSAGITEIVTYPQKRILRIITWATRSGKDQELWTGALSNVEEYARHNGCDLLEAYARKGLAKKLKWDSELVIITKNLGD